METFPYCDSAPMYASVLRKQIIRHRRAAACGETIETQFARNLCRILSDCRPHTKLSHLRLIYVKLKAGLHFTRLHKFKCKMGNFFSIKLLERCAKQMAGVLLHKHCHIVANSWITWEAAEVRAASNFSRCRGGSFGPEGVERIGWWWWGGEVLIYYFSGL